MNPSAALSEENSPAYFWSVLREYISHAFSLFGAPAAIAHKIWISRAEHGLISDWLAVCEAMLRRLIFIDALALQPETARAEQKRQSRNESSAAFGAAFDPNTPESWRVSFALGAAPHRRHAPATQPARKHQCAHTDPRNAAPLALRLEALVRGFNGREQLARRAALLLQRQAARALAFLAPTRNTNRAKPGFAQVRAVTELARAAFSASAARQDSS